ncbi:hypothetical protein BD410DRAFT_733003 [Rickenella mellea]|uniref:Uncharacterized protein n=1 Tax=Rickenella mellea TaxID=50990 RepID=A0A4Y7PK39_9AGAM|nr:hypothetical protein BD410DRAFT_733003 [Rickenella mellea]
MVVPWLQFSLAVFICGLAFSYVLHGMLLSIQSSLAPMAAIVGIACRLPMASTMFTCDTRAVGVYGHGVDFPHMMQIQTQYFDKLLDESAASVGSALKILKADHAFRNLAMRLEYSDLDDKDVLIAAILAFQRDAKGVGKSLRKLNAKTSGEVDRIILINEYAMRTLQGSEYSGDQSTDEKLVQTFDEVMAVLSVSLDTLRVKAEEALHGLEKLDEQLSTIHSIVYRTNKSIGIAKDRLLASLWTIVGGNTAELRVFGENLQMLRDVDWARSHALAYVTGAVHELENLSADLEDLRDRCAAPKLLEGNIPYSTHVTSISVGIFRLVQSREAADAKQASLTEIQMRPSLPPAL